MLPDSLVLPSGSAPVIWRRSARARRISLRIEPRAGGVIVTLPPRASADAGRAVLLAHHAWVSERLARLPAAVALRDGASVPLHGRPHRIVHEPGLVGAGTVQGDEIHAGGDAAFLARRVKDVLRAQARQCFGQLSLAKARSAGLSVRRVLVKDTSSRWGSCTADGALMFSWRLIMAPPEVQDYVVGHEVAHLRHMNHGREFWALADRLTPHRRFATAWLASHGAALMRIG